MLLNSLAFWLFLPLVLAAFWAIPSRMRLLRQGALLAASYAFYAFWDVRFLGLIVLSTAVDFWVARRLPLARHPRAWLAVTIALPAARRH